MNNLEKYNMAFVNALAVSVEEVPELIYGKSDAWDSVGQMSLISEIEESFDIYFEPQDILKFTSYEAGKKILEKYSIIF